MEQKDSVQNRLHEHFQPPGHVFKEDQIGEGSVIHASQMTERGIPQKMKLLFLVDESNASK